MFVGDPFSCFPYLNRHIELENRLFIRRLREVFIFLFDQCIAVQCSAETEKEREGRKVRQVVLSIEHSFPFIDRSCLFAERYIFSLSLIES